MTETFEHKGVNFPVYVCEKSWCVKIVNKGEISLCFSNALSMSEGDSYRKSTRKPDDSKTHSATANFARNMIAAATSTPELPPESTTDETTVAYRNRTTSEGIKAGYIVF